MDRVTVFRFRLQGDESEDALFPRAATAQRICQIQDAVAVVPSALVVDSHCVDSRGFLIEPALTQVKPR